MDLTHAQQEMTVGSVVHGSRGNDPHVSLPVVIMYSKT